MIVESSNPVAVIVACCTLLSTVFQGISISATEMTNYRSQTEAPKTLRYVVSENVENGTIIADIMTDGGFRRKYSSSVLELLEFRFVTSPPLGAPLIVGRKSGDIRIGGVVDREIIASCRDKDVCLLALDVAVSPGVYFTIIKLTVEITDVNDNSPHFRQVSYSIEVRESTSAGSSFPLPTAYDPDSRLFGIRRYQFDPETEVPNIALSVTSRADGSLDPRLVVRHQLDRETESEYRLILWAIDGGQPSLTATADVTVHVIDSNDHSPVFERTVYTVNISENISVGTVVVRTRATDADAGLNAVVIYKFSAQTESMYGRLFSINNDTGEIIIRSPPDREQYNIIQLTVIASDLGPDSLPTDTSVVIHVDDVNDNSPDITVSTLPTSSLTAIPVRRRTQSGVITGEIRSGGADVMENLAPGAFVAYVSVNDPDYGDNGRVDCDVINDDKFAMLRRHDKEFKLTTVASLDREAVASHVILITCSDHGEPAITSTRTLVVNVTDVNDNKPTFTQAAYTVCKSACLLSETNARYCVIVPLLHVTSTCTHVGTHAAHVTENNFVGTVIVQLTANDIDDNNNSLFDYVITNISSGSDEVSMTTGKKPVVIQARDLFHINSRGVVSASAIFDRERHSQFRLVVLAVDRGIPSQTGSTIVTVYVDDVNDEWPTFVSSDGVTATTGYVFRVVENDRTGGSLIGTVVAKDSDATSPNNRIQYSFVMSVGQAMARTWEQFVLDADTGDMYIRAPLDREYQSIYAVKVAAFDCGHPTAMTSVAMVTVHVEDENDNDPMIEFPLTNNSTVSVSSRAPVGYPIVRVVARDSDAGQNARLTYSVMQNGDLFRIDQYSGVLSVNSRFTNDAEYPLMVVVTDGGVKPRSSSASLTVHINSSLPFPVHAQAGDVSMSPAEVVRFGLIASSGIVLLLVVIILIAIVVTRRQIFVTGSEKARQRLSAVQVLTSDKVEQTSELVEESPTNTMRHESTIETIQSFGISSSYDLIGVQGRCHDSGDFDRGYRNGRRRLDEMTSFSTNSHVTGNHDTRNVSGTSYVTLPLTPINLGSVANARRRYHQQQQQQHCPPQRSATLERHYRRQPVIDRSVDNTTHDSSARGLLLGHVRNTASWYPANSHRQRTSLSSFDTGKLECSMPRNDGNELNAEEMTSQSVWMLDPDVIRIPK